MTESVLIREAAANALRMLGRPATVDEIYAEISRAHSFEFHTPTPEHVLRTTIRRHTGNVEHSDSSALIFFTMVEHEVYTLSTPTDSKAQKSAKAVGFKRIHRATDKEEIIRLLTSEQVSVFKEIWRLLMFAAQVGYANGRRHPLSSVDSGKGIDQIAFGNNPAWPGVMYLMALANTGTADILGGSTESEEQRITVFQEYANGGLDLLQEHFASRTPSLEAFVEFIDIQRIRPQEAPDLDLSI